jgi:hypothetical protein
MAMTIGIDLGDQSSPFAVLDAAGDLVEEGRVRTTRPALAQGFTQEGMNCPFTAQQFIKHRQNRRDPHCQQRRGSTWFSAMRENISMQAVA